MLPEIAALFFAGIDTTGHTGTWTLFLLTQHPEVEAKLAAELDAAGLLATADCPQPRALEWADLGRLVYLQAVIKVCPIPYSDGRGCKQSVVTTAKGASQPAA